ncbi:MAG: hypothetical protein ACUVS7_04405 [Bryobacteraceae bacterium]
MGTGQPQPESQGGGFVFESRTPKLRVQIDFGVVDKIASEALRGLGALPRRGIEVGGLLLGRADSPQMPGTVRIEGCVPFACEHLYGPNFQLSPKDREGFSQLVDSWQRTRNASLYAVGLYRSHTRGELELTQEDVELLDAFFPQAYVVCLLVRPFAIRAGEAALWLRRGGAFHTGPPAQTFPFRRKELGGGDAPQGVSTLTPQRTAPPTARAGADAAAQQAATESGEPAVVETLLGGGSAAPSHPPEARGRSGWLWLASSVLFFLTGVLVGIHLTGGWPRPAAVAPPADPYSLNLSAVQFGETIHFRWNPNAPALLACRSASLVIRDGNNTKILDLRKEDLARGTLIYRQVSSDVQFRLEAVFSPANSLSESVHLRLLPSEAGSESPVSPIR